MEQKVYCNNYKDNQYEDTHYRESPGVMVKARYIEQKEPTYQGNVLIEALPPERDVKAIYKDILKLPIFSEIEREESIEYRLNAIYRLQDYVMPTHQNILVDTNLSLALRRGYVNKKVNSTEFIKQLHESAEAVRSGFKNPQINKEFVGIFNEAVQNVGFLMIGMSGEGKSTAINKSLSYYPQVIEHSDISNNFYKFIQITWIKIDCSYNGNIKGICQKFFGEIDRLVGTDYKTKYGKQSFSIDRMICEMSHLARYYAIGALVIDELQHLGKNAQSEGLMNFFVSLSNEIKLPIIYIGTYKVAKGILARDFRHARRSTGTGTIEFGFMDEADSNNFLERLWKYQWVKMPAELTDEIKTTFYEKTLGIKDSIVKLFMAIQVEAIMCNDEEITLKLINRVAEDKFVLTKKMIKAFKTKDLNALAQLEDMTNIDIEGLFENALQTTATKEQVKQLYEAECREGKRTEIDLVNELIISLNGFGFDMKVVEKETKEVISQEGIKAEKEVLRKKIMMRLLGLVKQK